MFVLGCMLVTVGCLFNLLTFNFTFSVLRRSFPSPEVSVHDVFLFDTHRTHVRLFRFPSRLHWPSRRPPTFHNKLSNSSERVFDIFSFNVPKPTQSYHFIYASKDLRTTSINNLSAAHSVLLRNPCHVSELPSVAARKNRLVSFSHCPALNTIYRRHRVCLDTLVGYPCWRGGSRIPAPTPGYRHSHLH